MNKRRSQVIRTLNQIIGGSRRKSPLRRAARHPPRPCPAALERAVAQRRRPEGSDLPPRSGSPSRVAPSSKQPGREKTMEHRSLPYVEAGAERRPMAERPRSTPLEPAPRVPLERDGRPQPGPRPRRAPIGSGSRLKPRGFGCISQKTAVKDFWDDDEVRRVSYPKPSALSPRRRPAGPGTSLYFDHLQRRRVGHAGPLGRWAAQAGDRVL